MLGLDCWEFCTKSDCPDRDLPYPWQVNILVRLWLQQSCKDPLKMQTLRGLLQQRQIGIQLPRMSDELVVDQIAELLASGKMHLHARGSTEAVFVQDEAPGPPAKPKFAEQEAAFPLTDRQPSPQPAPSEPTSDPPTFSPSLDGAAQAAALSAAAAGGQPFCPE